MPSTTPRWAGTCPALRRSSCIRLCQAVVQWKMRPRGDHDEPFPGLVVVPFVDAEGRRWSLIDKSHIFTQLDELTPDSVYPVNVTVACVIQNDSKALAGDEVVTVSTSPDGWDTLRRQFMAI